jgi:hypothetical protein
MFILLSFAFFANAQTPMPSGRSSVMKNISKNDNVWSVIAELLTQDLFLHRKFDIFTYTVYWNQESGDRICVGNLKGQNSEIITGFLVHAKRLDYKKIDFSKVIEDDNKIIWNDKLFIFEKRFLYEDSVE